MLGENSGEKLISTDQIEEVDQHVASTAQIKPPPKSPLLGVNNANELISTDQIEEVVQQVASTAQIKPPPKSPLLGENNANELISTDQIEEVVQQVASTAQIKPPPKSPLLGENNANELISTDQIEEVVQQVASTAQIKLPPKSPLLGENNANELISTDQIEEVVQQVASTAQIKPPPKSPLLRENNVKERIPAEKADVVVSTIKEKLPQKSPSPTQRCIFRVPVTLRRYKKHVYLPKLVSIGPFHRRKHNLKEMEGIKLWYLHCLLERSPTVETSLVCFAKAIREMETNCRDCYAEQIRLDSDQFIEMMVVDGCFIIELFRKFKGTVRIEKDDPVCNAAWMFCQLAHDLLLLENQLPWQVLERLWYQTTPHEECERDGDEYSLKSHALHFFKEILATTFPTDTPGKVPENKHLLDFLRNNLLGSFEYFYTTFKTEGDLIPCATKLSQAGVKFKKWETDNFLYMDFCDGVFEIPPIFVQENTEFLLKNVIAFEQCDPSCSNTITSYGALLGSLINSSKDLAILYRKGIVISLFKTKDTLNFFKGLSEGIVVNSPCYYGNLCYEVNLFGKKQRAHWQIRCNKWKTMLKRDYFNSPWSMIKFFAATLLLGFALVQTLYAILAYAAGAAQHF